MSRPPRPDDLYRLRVATEPRLSPDGRWAVVAVQIVAPDFDAYRQALWIAATDGSAPARQLTIGAHHDQHPRFAPDGRSLAFLSDRRELLDDRPEDLPDDRSRERGHDRPGEPDRHDATQVHLLPLDGPGEARRLTDLPRGVTGFEWSPDGSRLAVLTASLGPTRAEDDRRRGRRRRRPGTPPPSDYRFFDRLAYMYNGQGFIDDQVGHLWLVDAASGAATPLTDGPIADAELAWSPDGTRIAFTSNRRRDHDLVERPAIHVVDVATRRVTPITAGPRSMFGFPTWLPDGRTIAALGHRLEAHAGSRNDIWLLAADGSDATPSGGLNLSSRHDLMPASTMNSDVTVGEPPRLWAAPDGRSILFSAPIDGAYELWRLDIATRDVARLTEGTHYLSGWDAIAGPRGRARVAYLRSTATEPADLWVQDGSAEPTRLTTLNADVLADLDLQAPIERHVTVDGRDIHGWYLPPARPGSRVAGRRGTGPAPLVTEIHGGPHTLYGWSLLWEFQVLAGAGIGVFYSNPRGSEGYGQAFNDANHLDWGPGPARDVLAGVEALVADGLADPDRLGLAGGSYGGYLTTWIVGHDDRFRAAMTCRSVSDMSTLMLSGDISTFDWARIDFNATPLEAPERFREMSPLTYADRIRTPLLIQHSERDLRTTVTQAEMLFTALRSLRRPVRLLRVPEETHELTRSGTPFRRVENLEVVLGWFGHYLVRGRSGLPALPRVRAGR